MYAQHFGLKKRPFRTKPVGSDVFMGPNIATTMAGIKKALTGSDTIVTVSGPVGLGKTTLVNRALAAIAANCKIISVSRLRLDCDDVLELLLNDLGMPDVPNGTIQKFALFRRHLRELAENGSRVVITVEDGLHLGADTLAEIEALTAADAGESDGASIVLMGDQGLPALLDKPALSRLQQRIRQRFSVIALPVAELRGYLRHCFRLAGRDFEQVFESNAAELLHLLSGGIPRIANNVVESAMTAAADQDLALVSTELLARVAENEYGLSAAGFCAEEQPPAKPVLAAVSAPIAVAKSPPTIKFVVPEDAKEIPELIQDTLPDLEILAPELTNAAPEPAAVVGASANDDIPAWDRDPTMAELRPDIAALEHAMASIREDAAEPATDDSDPLPEPVAEEPVEIPEITLDHAISQRIAKKRIETPGADSAAAVADDATAPNDANSAAPGAVPKRDAKADAEIAKIASELAKAKSIEDVDDKMAETLFGDEINFVAAQILANPPAIEPANDEIDLAEATEPTDIEVTLQAPTGPDESGLDVSASQRLKTVRALNADLHPSLREPEPVAAPSAISIPESIEDQINTSLTQTLKTLKITPPPANDVDDEESGSGFFGRFKRS